jgi:hypothetical protein
MGGTGQENSKVILPHLTSVNERLLAFYRLEKTVRKKHKPLINAQLTNKTKLQKMREPLQNKGVVMFYERTLAV